MQILRELQYLESKGITIDYDRASGTYTVRLTRRVTPFLFNSIVRAFNKHMRYVKFKMMTTRKGRNQLVATWQCTNMENVLATARSVSEYLIVSYRLAKIAHLESEIELTLQMNRSFPTPDVEVVYINDEVPIGDFMTVDDDLPF